MSFYDARDLLEEVVVKVGAPQYQGLVARIKQYLKENNPTPLEFVTCNYCGCTEFFTDEDYNVQCRCCATNLSTNRRGIYE